MVVMEEDLQRVWQLLAELSSQLTQNREQCEQLKKQADDLKTQAIHTGTGYALKRFNVDLSKEQFESEVERMNAQLVVENQTLQHENRQLTILLKDYETTLEQIMTRFRTHAHSTQQHELDLTRYYESVLLSLMEKQQQSPIARAGYPNGPTPDGQGSMEMDPNTFHAIQNISILIQRAMRELSGEEPYLNEADELESQQAELAASPAVAKTEDRPGPAVQPPHGAGDSPAEIMFQDPFHPSGSKLKPDSDPHRRRSTSVIEFHPRLRDPASGGYVGKRNGSLSDYAMQSAIESERLRRENDYLREMLGIANDFSGQSEAAATAMAVAPTPGLVEPGEVEAHLAKLNSVVSDVIKEEEEEEDEKLAEGAGARAAALWPGAAGPSTAEHEHVTDEHVGGRAQRTEDAGSPWRTGPSDGSGKMGAPDQHRQLAKTAAHEQPESATTQPRNDTSSLQANTQN